MTVVETEGRRVYEPAGKTVLRMAAERTITETDLVTFANLFLTPSLAGKQKEVHAVQLISMMDGLSSGTYASPELNTLMRDIRRELVGDTPSTGGGSLGWSGWRQYRPVVPGVTIGVTVEVEKATTSRSRPGMVIYDLRKTAYAEHGEKLVEIVHQLGTW